MTEYCNIHLGYYFSLGTYIFKDDIL